VNADERWLKQVCSTPAGPYLRPFQPNPEWRAARVFLVGTNPATPLREEFTSFEQYWEGLTAVPELFISRYRAKHAAGESKTSARARRFLDQLKPINCLITNAFVYPARRPGEIPDKRRQRQLGFEVFDYLVRLVRPVAALFHGSEALQLAQTYFRIELDPYVPLARQAVARTISETGHPVRLYAYPHFSGQGVRSGFRVGLMDQELADLASTLRRQLEAG
jgi:hypothetical protein